jgi:hypothetical protein
MKLLAQCEAVGDFQSLPHPHILIYKAQATMTTDSAYYQDWLLWLR